MSFKLFKAEFPRRRRQSRTRNVKARCNSITAQRKYL